MSALYRDRISCFGFAFDAHHAEPNGEFAVHNGTGSKHARSQQVSEFDAGPPLLDLLEAAAHVAHTGDAIGNEQRENGFFIGA